MKNKTKMAAPPRQMIAPPSNEVNDNSEWWARLWLKKASPSEIEAMRHLLAKIG